MENKKKKSKKQGGHCITRYTMPPASDLLISRLSIHSSFSPCLLSELPENVSSQVQQTRGKEKGASVEMSWFPLACAKENSLRYNKSSVVVCRYVRADTPTSLHEGNPAQENVAVGPCSRT